MAGVHSPIFHPDLRYPAYPQDTSLPDASPVSDRWLRLCGQARDTPDQISTTMSAVGRCSAEPVGWGCIYFLSDSLKLEYSFERSMSL